MQKRGFCRLLASHRAPVQAVPTVRFPAVPKPGPKRRGDQPLPGADLLFPRELQALPQPSQGIIRGNLSPNPELSTLAQRSGQFPFLHGLWELSRHLQCLSPVPGTPVRPLGTLEPGENQPPPTAGCASPWWELFPEDGCHEDGATPSITPSTNWLPCFGGQGISRAAKIDVPSLQQEKLCGPGLRVDPCQGPGIAQVCLCQPAPGGESFQPKVPWGGDGHPSRQPLSHAATRVAPSPPSCSALGNVPGERPAVKSCSSWNVGGRARLLESQRHGGAGRICYLPVN